MPSQKMSRRQALKILLAASGGLTAAAFLPAKWLKPIVSAGVLPAHARASAPYHLVQNRTRGFSVMAVAGNQITDAAPMHHLASPVDLTDLCFVETLQNILITMSYTTPAHGFATPPTMPAPRLTGGTGPEILTYSGGLTTCAITTEYVATFTQPEFTLNDVIDTFSWVFTAPNGSSIQLPRLVS